MTQTRNGTSGAALFKNPDFAWMMGGGLISMLGDQFTYIALPWLVLQLTGDTLALGLVLGVMSVPRAVFMLVGGAVVDRHSPKQVMMWTKHVSTVLLVVLAALVLTGQLSLWALYLLAFGLGLAMAFSIPAGTSLLPHVVPAGHLPAANGMLMGLRQLTMFAGPLLAGVLIATFGDSHAERLSDARGLGAAFLFDAASFALSAWTLSKVRTTAPVGPAEAPRGQAVLRSVAEGLRWCWKDQDLRTCFLYWSAVSLLVSGPIQVAVPVLASQRLGPGAAAFGVLMGAHGLGTLAGMVAAGARPGTRARNLGTTLLLVDGVIAVLFIPLGLITALWQGASLVFAIGLLGGFMQVAVFTWIQRRVPPTMLGRAMSIFMFIFMGLTPISAAVTGWVMRGVTLAQLFAVMGGCLLAAVTVALATSRMRHISDGPTPVPGR
ncbi:MFS transporter [Pyxidicoccus fallax]|uniref:MFS transporter n=1 Tax=Pyxidicoccus fallax TaxID=394095 RepID=A0A848LEN4_9BACT|nr:MFS transporter [Pyxidicoccus fallax]NMO16936.1 MFS transporter [Pyxidicoccus fallax]NPC81173.1 MFS transporter [Pyxidicoccus fallax]